MGWGWLVIHAELHLHHAARLRLSYCFQVLFSRFVGAFVRAGSSSLAASDNHFGTRLYADHDLTLPEMQSLRAVFQPWNLSAAATFIPVRDCSGEVQAQQRAWAGFPDRADTL